MHYRMHRQAAAAAQARRRGQQQQQQKERDPALALWEPQAPFRNPALPGREGNTNVWFNPHKGGLIYDETWLRRRLEG